MSINNTSLSFSANDVPMWGTGTEGINQTSEMWAVNLPDYKWESPLRVPIGTSQLGSFGLNLAIPLFFPGLEARLGVTSASLGLHADADIKLGIVTSLQGTGDVDINYGYDTYIYSPDIALTGTEIEINTANWQSNYESIVSNSPGFQFGLDFVYQLEGNLTFDYQYNIGGAVGINIPFLGFQKLFDVNIAQGGGDLLNILSFELGDLLPNTGLPSPIIDPVENTNGLKVLPIARINVNSNAAGTTADYLNVNLLGYNATLPGNASFNFDNLLGLPVTGSLSLPHVQTSAVNTTPTQNDTLTSYGKGSTFFQLNADSNQLLDYFFGADKAKFEGNVSVVGTNYHYTAFNANLTADASLLQKFTFNPDNIVVDLTSSSGETKRGVLGDTFLFNVPQSGSGFLTFTAKYYLSGMLTNNTGVSGEVLVDLEMLKVDGLGALIDGTIPLLNGDNFLGSSRILMEKKFHFTASSDCHIQLSTVKEDSCSIAFEASKPSGSRL